MYAAYKYRLVSWCHSRLPNYWHNNIGIIYSKEITTAAATTTAATATAATNAGSGMWGNVSSGIVLAS